MESLNTLAIVYQTTNATTAKKAKISFLIFDQKDKIKVSTLFENVLIAHFNLLKINK